VWRVCTGCDAGLLWSALTVEVIVAGALQQIEETEKRRRRREEEERERRSGAKYCRQVSRLCFMYENGRWMRIQRDTPRWTQVSLIHSLTRWISRSGAVYCACYLIYLQSLVSISSRAVAQHLQHDENNYHNYHNNHNCHNNHNLPLALSHACIDR
jgi:hypothetical protein